MGFSKKVGVQQSGTQNNVDSEAWGEWNKYQYDCFSAKEKEMANGKLRKEKTLIGQVNLIMDLGTPPAPDNKWATKCALPLEGEEYSQEEIEWKEKNPTHDFIWDEEWDETLRKRVPVRKQTSPSYPSQEFGVAVDFPQILIDYSKHPNSTTDVEDLRPLRISLNGSFHQQFPKPITFDGSYKPVSDKNLIYKICSAAGREKELLDSQFDIGVAAEARCNFLVRLDLKEKDNGGYNLYPSASKPTPVEDIDVAGVELSAEQQVEGVFKDKPLSPFVGILLNGQEHTDEMLTMLGKDTFGYVKRASESKQFNISGISKAGKEYSFDKGVDYLGSDFQKAWDKFSGENTGSANSTPPKETPEKQEAPAKVDTTPSMPEEDVDGLDFDEIPF